MTDLPPKPPSRPDQVSLWTYLRLFRRDLLSAQPARLYGAWMAEFRTPFFRSYLVNQPDLLRIILKERPADFPKSERVGEGLRPLLGRSVFVTNGAEWAAQRRIIDPAFEGGKLKESFAAMWAASVAARNRLAACAGQGPVEFEAQASHAAADVIFRTLFSLPIEDRLAAEVFAEFRAYQRAQPLLNIAAFVPLPKWMPRWIPRGHGRRTWAAAGRIRGLIGQLVAQRAEQIAREAAPDDLATKIMTTPDPETGRCFSAEEMVDQVAIFFLAGHETSASALSWALYLLATHPVHQDRVASEAQSLDLEAPAFAQLSQLRQTRDVFREALRLYPPVPMMVREATRPEVFRNRTLRKASQIVLSPWHLHRHTRLWDNPDGFDPDRWQSEASKASARDAYMPFSEGARVCPGAGFAMAEGVLMLALLLRDLQISPVEGKVPVPVAHLTVRARDGIWLQVARRI